MGSDNSKPSDVSDATWEKVQYEKLKLINIQTSKLDEENIQLKNNMNQVVADYSDYCSACNDVPKIMMIVPSYRKTCSQAREKILNDVSGMISGTVSIKSTQEMINTINKM